MNITDFSKHFRLQAFRDFYKLYDALHGSIHTWGSISGQRLSWPSPTHLVGACHQESHKKTDEDVEERPLLSPCQTVSHQKQLLTARKQGMSVHGHGEGWGLRHSQHQCWPVLGLRDNTVFFGEFEWKPSLKNINYHVIIKKGHMQM